MPPLHVLHVASEVAPWSQTGGLGDVAAALPDALARSGGAACAVLSPLYRGASARLAAAAATLEPALPRSVVVGGTTVEVGLRRLRQPGRADAWFVDAPGLYDRDGLYGPGGGADFDDNWLRFAVLCRVAVDHGAELLGGRLDVVHAHDWQGAMCAPYLRLAGSPAAAVLTIHNLAFRGLVPKDRLADLGLPWSEFTADGVEFWDQVSLLKAGLAHADVVTTVSPRYADEIVHPAAGEGLDGFLRHRVRRLVGIVNGIDDEAWDPAVDAALPATFSADSLDGKQACRAALAAEHRLTLGPGSTLLALVSRLTSQKGIDLVAELVPELHALDARLVVLGAGDPALENRLRWLAATFRRNVAVRIGFDVGAARRIYGGADVFLMPSRFEPCGIGQLYAMRYGAVPVVHATGGLRDTVLDPGDDALCEGLGTGIVFEHADVGGLRWALRRAVRLRRTRPDGWRALVRAAMRRDASWGPSARAYLAVYDEALEARR